jgi:hypothetical protein
MTKPAPAETGKLQRIAVQVLAKSGFPLLLLLVIAIFLIVQDRIDRKDPKLALAPVYADPNLAFEHSRASPGSPLAMTREATQQ